MTTLSIYIGKKRMIHLGLMLLMLSGATYILSYLTDVHKMPLSEIRLNINASNIKTVCSKTVVPCKKNTDCHICKEVGVPCYKGKCILPQAKSSCNKQHGGLEVLTLNPLHELHFDCVCLYPNFYKGEGCKEKSDHVCQNGQLQMDISQGIINCTCPANQMVKIVRRNFHHPYPICIPKTAAWLEKYQ